MENEIVVNIVRSNEIHDVFHVKGYGSWQGLDEYIYRPMGIATCSDIAIEFIK